MQDFFYSFDEFNEFLLMHYSSLLRSFWIVAPLPSVWITFSKLIQSSNLLRLPAPRMLINITNSICPSISLWRKLLPVILYTTDPNPFCQQLKPYFIHLIVYLPIWYLHILTTEILWDIYRYCDFSLGCAQIELEENTSQLLKDEMEIIQLRKLKKLKEFYAVRRKGRTM